MCIRDRLEGVVTLRDLLDSYGVTVVGEE